MKKYLLAALLLAAPILVFAQFKVDANGHVAIGGRTPHIDTDLLLGNTTTVTTYRHGIQSYYHFPSDTFAVAVTGRTYTDDIYGRTIGVFGYSSGGTNDKHFGTIGSIQSTNKGAGVYGTCTSGYMGTAASGTYAGYFNGPVYTNGTLTAQEILNLSDINLKENIIVLGKDKDNTESALENIMDMNVIKYNFKKPVIDEEEIKDDDSFYNDEEMRKVANLALEKYAEDMSRQKHYGLSAQELREIYPDLVREGQDGYLGINYIELVPILIRSIQELNEKIEQLNAQKGDAEYKTRSINDENADLNAAAAGNVLYQNTPNPFKEQTTIRFQLADDATNAAICIFDMSGKMLKKLPVSSGMTCVSINGWELGEGMFLYTLIVNGREIDTKRMILSK
jgi:hypothetical protein